MILIQQKQAFPIHHEAREALDVLWKVLTQVAELVTSAISSLNIQPVDCNARN